MRLAWALRVLDGDVVAIVGGGGKTSTLYRLAAELAEPGTGRVVVTTTTKMLLPREGDADGLFLHRDFDTIATYHAETLPYLRRIVVAPDLLDTAEGWKLGSAPLDWPRRLADLPRVANVLVEADGSRHLPLKAPAEYEPPIPPEANMVIVVVGLGAVGEALDDAHVHRAERVAALAGQPLGSTVTAETIARVLTHADGGLKHVPPGARAVALLNRVTSDTLPLARDVARRILARPGYEAVLIGAVQADDPIWERHARVGVVVLAAGGASRYGVLKQTLPWGDTTLVGHALRVAQASGATQTVLITGANAVEVVQAAQAVVGGWSSAVGPPWSVVNNPAWRDGLSTSVKAGLAALGDDIGVAVFLLADQPAVTAELVQTLVRRYIASGAPIVVPTFGGRRGNPTLWDRDLWHELMQVEGDQGGRGLIEDFADQVAFVEVGEAATIDIDTPDDYRRLTGAG